MNLTDILAQAGGLKSVARDLGVSEVLPLPAMLVAGFMAKQTGGGEQAPEGGGLGGLGGLIGSLGGLFGGGGAGAAGAARAGGLGGLSAVLASDGPT